MTDPTLPLGLEIEEPPRHPPPARGCSRGWTGRCARAKGKKCRCACGGQNHGTDRPKEETMTEPTGVRFSGSGPRARIARANYEIVPKSETPSSLLAMGLTLVIRDLGPWDRYPTVTNDVEKVVRELVDFGYLEPTARLFYWDSDGRLDQILVVGGQFYGFKAGPIV